MRPFVAMSHVEKRGAWSMTTMAGERACQRFHGTAPYFLSGLFAQLLRNDRFKFADEDNNQPY